MRPSPSAGLSAGSGAEPAIRRARAAAATASAGASRAARAIGSVPFAAFFVGTTLVVTSLVRWGVSDDEVVLRWMSTNVHNLAHRPISSIVASAFYIDSRALAAWSIALAVVLVAVERRYGSLRAIAAFASGHVLATLATEGVVAIGVWRNTLPDADADWLDVGVSYGLASTLGVAIYLLPARWARLAGAAVGAGLIADLVLDPDMTPAGHCLAYGIGLALGAFLHRSARPR
jgi:hypothetical protein